MKRTMFALFVAALVVSPVAAADKTADKQERPARSAGAHPVVYDDYPESDVVIDVGPDIVLTVTGEARTRFEWIENTTDFSNNGRDNVAIGFDDDQDFNDGMSYAPSRYNLGIRADLPRDVAAVIDLQGNFDMGGGAAGIGTELRAQTTQHQRPGVVNGVLFGPALGHIGGGNGAIPEPADPTHLEVVRTLEAAATDQVFVYQGYMEAAHVGDSIFSVRIGRQEFAYGTEFLLGNQDFYDGQSMDGIKGILEFSDNSRLDLFWAKLAERDTTLPSSAGANTLNQGGNDSDLYGAYFSTKCLGGSSIGMDAYVLGLTDGSNLTYNYTVSPSGDSVSGTFYTNEPNRTYLSSYWAGLRFFRDREHGFHFSAEGTYQWGRMEANADENGDGIVDDTRMTISAWAFEGWLGYTWNTPSNPTIKGNVTWASGSNSRDFSNADWHTFFTPGGEVHPRLGLMDLVDASNILSFNLGYAGSHERHSWGVDLYDFHFDKVDPVVQSAFVSDAALVAGHDFSKELGQEVDLWYNYQYSEHMVAQFAVAYFNAGSFITDRNRCGTADSTCDPNAPEDADSIHTNDAWRVYANLLVRF